MSRWEVRRGEGDRLAEDGGVGGPFGLSGDMREVGWHRMVLEGPQMLCRLQIVIWKVIFFFYYLAEYYYKFSVC